VCAQKKAVLDERIAKRKEAVAKPLKPPPPPEPGSNNQPLPGRAKNRRV